MLFRGLVERYLAKIQVSVFGLFLEKQTENRNHWLVNNLTR